MNIPKIFKIEHNHIIEHIEDVVNRTLLFKIVDNVYNCEELNELDYLKSILGISQDKLCMLKLQNDFDKELKNTTLKNSRFTKFDYILIYDNYQKIKYIINKIISSIPFKINHFTTKEKYQINQNLFEYYEKYNLDIKFYLNELYNEISKIDFITYDKEKLRQLLIKYYEILKSKSINVKSYFEYIIYEDKNYNGNNTNKIINAINNLKNVIDELN